MSFITKRERVFNDYDQFELPARNEGKLKTYTSCTDTRAWSHFYSDKAEHLVDIIRRNNQICRAKYVPTDVIVNTLMAAKNAEIARLKRRVEEFEQMVAVYDQLELTGEQKFEIASAHAAIKQANKELEDLCINLDMSNYTEGIESDTYQSGIPSGEPGNGDEWQNYKRDEENQCTFDIVRRVDSSTNATDPRIDDMREALISKDAKLNALQNIKAILENEICEPYCIYAHIYTALEKIFGILYQNDKYKVYLIILGSGKDTRFSDIKGKILHRLHVLEKFNTSLISPCCFEYDPQAPHFPERLQNSFHYCTENPQQGDTAQEFKKGESNHSDKKKAQYSANITDEEEIEDIVSKENLIRNESLSDLTMIDDYNIDNENMKRLRALQLSYEDLVTCHENVKHERDRLVIKCNRYEDLEKECFELRNQLRQFNSLWNEKEHYRRRSEELDNLKEQYLILAEETSNIETKLKAETEINGMRCLTIEELRNNNMALEKKLNDISLLYDKEKNALLCKLKEMECQIMCQEQQIKSLTSQIDRLIEQEHDNVNQVEDNTKTVMLMDDIEALKDQIKGFKELLFCSDEEKLQLQDQLQNSLKLISELKAEVEDWKCSCEKAIEHNKCLERYSNDYREQMQNLAEENRRQKRDAEEKNMRIANLVSVINDKSQEIANLQYEIAQKREENEYLLKRLENIQKIRSVCDNEKEKSKTIEKWDTHGSQESIEQFYQSENIDQAEYIRLQETLLDKENQLERLHNELKFQTSQNESLELEILRLKEENECALNDTKKLTDDKSNLEMQLQKKHNELENIYQSIDLYTAQSRELLEKLQHAESIKIDYATLQDDYNKVLNEKITLEKELVEMKRSLNEKCIELSNVSEKLTKIRNEDNSIRVMALEEEIKQSNESYSSLYEDKIKLQEQYNKKTEELNDLYKAIEIKIEENTALMQQMKFAKENLVAVENELAKNKAAMNAVVMQTETLNEKLNDYENLACEFEKLNLSHRQVKQEKEMLQKELERYLDDLKYLEEEKMTLSSYKSKLEIRKDPQFEPKAIEPEYFPYAQILKEVDVMKGEKEANQRRIHELIEKLEKSEQIISNLNEDLMTRDDKIAILENHINALEDEVRRLHINLETMINTGEQMKESYHKVSESMSKMETQHFITVSKMKEEFAKLQDEKTRFENQLSVANTKFDETFKDLTKYASQTVHLEHEKDIIIDFIKKLEAESTGQTTLSHENCNTEQVIQSLDKIRKHINLKNTKNVTLEQTILKVQNSSEILKSKADEAKKIIEKEKQKIWSEKEEAIAARINMEVQLNDLRKQLEEQRSKDMNIIQDLESEIMNQKLLIEKINKSKQNYIAKLEEDTKILQNLYDNALTKVSELEVEKQEQLIEKSQLSDIISELNKNLERKMEEILDLQKTLEEIKTKFNTNVTVAIQFSPQNLNMSSQTDKYKYPCDIKNSEVQTCSTDYSQMWSQTELFEKINEKDDSVDINLMNFSLPPKEENRPVKDLLPKKIQPTNEVQILAIAVEPAFDFVRSTYLNYKLNRLSVGHLEQYSVSCFTHTTDTDVFSNQLLNQDQLDSPVKQNFSDTQSIRKVLTNVSSKSRCNNNESETESIPDEDLLVIYQDSDNLSIEKSPSNLIWENDHQDDKELLEEVSQSQYYQHNEDVRVTIIDSSSLQSTRVQELYLEGSASYSQEESLVDQNSLLYNENQDVCCEQREQIPSRCELSRIAAEYLLLKDHSKTEFLNDNKKCIEIPEILNFCADLDQYRKRTSKLKSKSDNFLHSVTVRNDQAVLVKIDATQEFENKIQSLTEAITNIEKDYKLKIEAVKAQYNANIKKMINEHNQGVKCIQSLHEETTNDLLRRHENEIENLRTMSLEAMRKVEQLENENLNLKVKLESMKGYLDEEPVKISSTAKARKPRRDTSYLTKTNVEAFNVKPKAKTRGPCACCAGSNISNAIRGRMQFEDAEKRKQAEYTVLNDIARKMIGKSSIEHLDKQELLFLHSKVCRQWKKKYGKNDILSRKIDELESEVLNRQRKTQEHMRELNRIVAEERLCMQEANNRIYSQSPLRSGYNESTVMGRNMNEMLQNQTLPTSYMGQSQVDDEEFNLGEQSTYAQRSSCLAQRMKRLKDNVPSKVEYDEAPTSLRRSGKTPPSSARAKKFRTDRK